MTSRNLVLYVGGALVLMAAIGAIYLEILVQSRSTHTAWMVTQDVTAGTVFTAQNARQVRGSNSPRTNSSPRRYNSLTSAGGA